MKVMSRLIYVFLNAFTTSGRCEQMQYPLVTVISTKGEQALESYDQSFLDVEDIQVQEEPRLVGQKISSTRRKLVKQTPVDEIEPSVHQCVHYTRKVTKLYTLNDPPLRCVMCDPTTSFCNPICQKWVDYQFAACQGVCLPEGFFFDAGIHVSSARFIILNSIRQL